jgi:hypothetical protein
METQIKAYVSKYAVSCAFQYGAEQHRRQKYIQQGPAQWLEQFLILQTWKKIDTTSSMQIMFPWLLQLNLISELAIPRSFWIRSLLMLVCLMVNSLVASKRVTESSPPPSSASSISFLFRHVFWQWMPLSYSSLPSQQSIWTYTICQHFCYPQRNQYSK